MHRRRVTSNMCWSVRLPSCQVSDVNVPMRAWRAWLCVLGGSSCVSSLVGRISFRRCARFSPALPVSLLVFLAEAFREAIVRYVVDRFIVEI